MLRWIFFVVVYLIMGFYALQGIRTATRQPWVHYCFIFVSLLVIGNFIYQFSIADSGRVLSRPKSYAFGFLLAMLSFQLITILFLFGEDIFRLLVGTYNKWFNTDKEFTIPARRRFLSVLGLGLAALPFGALLYGMYKGKYNYKVLTYELEFDDLPEAFHNYQITQISDIHSGSFDDYKKIEYGVDLINQQNSDVILFTGDMVNNMASEMKPWKALFGSLQAKDGKFSVLGNHDYGDYVEWETSEAKAKNLEELKAMQKEMGFRLCE